MCTASIQKLIELSKLQPPQLSTCRAGIVKLARIPISKPRCQYRNHIAVQVAEPDRNAVKNIPIKKPYNWPDDGCIRIRDCPQGIRGFPRVGTMSICLQYMSSGYLLVLGTIGRISRRDGPPAIEFQSAQSASIRSDQALRRWKAVSPLPACRRTD